MLALPLIHEGEICAVLALYASSKHAFTDDHARLLELLAPKLAASLAVVAAPASIAQPRVVRRPPRALRLV